MALVAAVPAPRSAGSRPVALPMKRLREVPAISGRPSRVQLAEAHHQVEILLRRLLGEAEAGVEHDLLVGHAGRPRDLQRAAKEEELVVDDVGRSCRARARYA